MRDIFHIKPKYQSITQGSIITGCIADEISINNVWGCIITARCDLDNKKVQRVHYLPIISFDDWLKYCASTSIREAWKKSLFSHLRNALKNHGLSPSFMSKGLSRSDLEIIIDSFFNKKEVKSFWEAYDNLSLSDSIPLSEIINSPQGNGILKQEIDRLINNENSNYYLIEDWRNNSAASFMVVLLRDIKAISIECAFNLPDGIFEDDVEDPFFSINDLKQTTNRSCFYYVDSEIKSPFIEHIVQRFSSNFSRIGVEDLPKAEVLEQLIDYSKEFLK